MSGQIHYPAPAGPIARRAELSVNKKAEMYQSEMKYIYVVTHDEGGGALKAAQVATASNFFSAFFIYLSLLWNNDSRSIQSGEQARRVLAIDMTSTIQQASITLNENLKQRKVTKDYKTYYEEMTDAQKSLQNAKERLKKAVGDKLKDVPQTALEEGLQAFNASLNEAYSKELLRLTTLQSHLEQITSGTSHENISSLSEKTLVAVNYLTQNKNDLEKEYYDEQVKVLVNKLNNIVEFSNTALGQAHRLYLEDGNIEQLIATHDKYFQILAQLESSNQLLNDKDLTANIQSLKDSLKIQETVIRTKLKIDMKAQISSINDRIRHIAKESDARVKTNEGIPVQLRALEQTRQLPTSNKPFIERLDIIDTSIAVERDRLSRQTKLYNDAIKEWEALHKANEIMLSDKDAKLQKALLSWITGLYNAYEMTIGFLEKQTPRNIEALRVAQSNRGKLKKVLNRKRVKPSFYKVFLSENNPLKGLRAFTDLLTPQDRIACERAIVHSVGASETDPNMLKRFKGLVATLVGGKEEQFFKEALESLKSLGEGFDANDRLVTQESSILDTTKKGLPADSTVNIPQLISMAQKVDSKRPISEEVLAAQEKDSKALRAKATSAPALEAEVKANYEKILELTGLIATLEGRFQVLEETLGAEELSAFYKQNKNSHLI